MPKTPAATATSATISAAKSLADSPKARSIARKLKTKATERGMWLPGRHGRQPVAIAELPPTPSDKQVTMALMDNLSQRAVRALENESDLPHQVVTDGNLARFLGRATDASESIAARGAPTGPRFAADTYMDQATANDSVVNALHQLDHRSLGQRHQLEDVESSISDLLRRMERLEEILDALQARTAPREKAPAELSAESGQAPDLGSESPVRPRIST